MMKSMCTHKQCKGAIMLAFGVLFFLGTLNVWPEFTFAKYWPLVLIVLGVHHLACKDSEGCCKSEMHSK